MQRIFHVRDRPEFCTFMIGHNFLDILASIILPPVLYLVYLVSRVFSCFSLAVFLPHLPNSLFLLPSPLPALHEAHKRLQWLQCPPSILCTAASPESQVSPGDSGTDPCGLCLVSHYYPLFFPHNTNTDSGLLPSVRNMRYSTVFIPEYTRIIHHKRTK